jgi:hypothetical protein
MALRRMAIRFGAIIMLVGSLIGCVSYAVADLVNYVPGHGYVVKVEHQYRDNNDLLLASAGYYYYVFGTEAEARRFIKEVADNRYAEIAKTHQPHHKEPSEEYMQIACALGQTSHCSADTGSVVRAMDRVVPSVPTAMPPQ